MREKIEIPMTSFDEHPEPIKKAIRQGKDVLVLHDAIEVVSGTAKNFEKYLFYIIIEQGNPVSHVQKYIYNYKNSKSYYYETPTIINRKEFTEKWELIGGQISNIYSISIKTKIYSDYAVVDKATRLTILDNSSRWIGKSESVTRSKDAPLELPNAFKQENLSGGSAALIKN